MKIVRIILAVAAAGVLSLALYNLFGISKTYEEAALLYRQIRETLGLEEDPEEGQALPEADAFTGEEGRYSSLSWDYPALLALCGDAVGYIYQEDVLSYPVVQAEDNEKYLRHLMNGEYNIAGTIFVDARFPEGLNGSYSVIYGHNMDDKSMFGSITSYKNEKYYLDHPEFELYVGEDCYVYYVLAAFETLADGFVFRFEPMTDEEFLELLEKARDLCPYETDAPEITEDSIVTVLSTCIDYPRDYNYRFVVLLMRGEKLVNRKTVQS